MKWENAVLRWRHASISPSVGIGENFFSEGAVSGQKGDPRTCWSRHRPQTCSGTAALTDGGDGLAAGLRDLSGLFRP